MKKSDIEKIFKKDDSLERHTHLMKRRQTIKVILLSAKSKLIVKDQITELLNYQKKENQKLKKMIQNQKIKNMKLTFYDVKPIIVIQKYVKGWLARRQFEEVKRK